MPSGNVPVLSSDPQVACVLPTSAAPSGSPVEAASTSLRPMMSSSLAIIIKRATGATKNDSVTRKWLGRLIMPFPLDGDDNDGDDDGGVSALICFFNR